MDILDLEKLIAKLLAHASPEIRIAALDLMTYSRSSIAPLSEQLLDTLRQNLPQFHAESNPKPRNEFISQMKKLCTRLRDCIYFLRKPTRLPSQPGVGKPSIPQERSINGISEDLELSQGLLEHQTLFLSWYNDFLVKELKPTSSYQRHITALKILPSLLGRDPKACPPKALIKPASNLDRGPLQKSIFTPQLLRCCFDLILDPFDDVRYGASILLELALPPPLQPSAPKNDRIPVAITSRTDGKNFDLHREDLIDTLYRAEILMRNTGRADHADGVGRLYSLLYGNFLNESESDDWHNSPKSILEHILGHLEHDIRIANNNVRKAVGEYPLHGYLIAIRYEYIFSSHYRLLTAIFRYIISRPDFFNSYTQDSGLKDPENWGQLHERIYMDSEKVWDAVKEILCIDSPEGHTPEEDEMDDLDVGAKDTLSFSWRALKESRYASSIGFSSR